MKRLIIALLFLSGCALPTAPEPDKCLETMVDSVKIDTEHGEFTVSWSAVCIDTIYAWIP